MYRKLFTELSTAGDPPFLVKCQDLVVVFPNGHGHQEVTASRDTSEVASLVVDDPITGLITENAVYKHFFLSQFV